MDIFRFGSCGPLVADSNWYYGARHTAANVRDDGDQLRLVADAVPSGGYTSAQVRTPPFVYGRVTVMARMPAGHGMWPALWLLNAPSTGALGEPEIDLLELPQTTTADRSTAHLGYHWTDPSGAAWQITATIPTPDLTAGFHRYVLDWQPDHVAWAIDDVEVWRVTGSAATTVGTPVKWVNGGYQRATPDAIPIHCTPLALLVTNGVGKAGAWAPAPDTTTPFPNAIAVDSITVEQS